MLCSLSICWLLICILGSAAKISYLLLTCWCCNKHIKCIGKMCHSRNTNQIILWMVSKLFEVRIVRNKKFSLSALQEPIVSCVSNFHTIYHPSMNQSHPHPLQRTNSPNQHHDQSHNPQIPTLPYRRVRNCPDTRRSWQENILIVV